MLPPVIVILALLGFFAGAYGALVGLGGGIILVPVLSLWFGLPIKTAVGISLVCVIATSTGAAAVYVQRHMTDLRLGMVLELATVLGAITGASAAAFLPDKFIKALFAAFLAYAGVMMLRGKADASAEAAGAVPEYRARHYPLGLGISYVAGGVSGVLGIGGGPIKVPMMYLLMGVPIKVAAATSNFMIGVTAAASAFLYYGRGDIIVPVAAPLATGVLAGALVGSRLSARLRSRWIRWLLMPVLFYLAALMIGEVLDLPVPGRRQP